MAMEETLALEEAVEVALSLTKREETLAIVTADHSHAVNIYGFEMIAQFINNDIKIRFLSTEVLIEENKRLIR